VKVLNEERKVAYEKVNSSHVEHGNSMKSFDSLEVLCRPLTDVNPVAGENYIPA
jgi:hypothetical protein